MDKGDIIACVVILIASMLLALFTFIDFASGYALRCYCLLPHTGVFYFRDISMLSDNELAYSYSTIQSQSNPSDRSYLMALLFDSK